MGLPAVFFVESRDELRVSFLEFGMKEFSGGHGLSFRGAAGPSVFKAASPSIGESALDPRIGDLVQ